MPADGCSRIGNEERSDAGAPGDGLTSRGIAAPLRSSQ